MPVDLRAQKPVGSSTRWMEGTTVSQIVRSAVLRLSIIQSVMMVSSHVQTSSAAPTTFRSKVNDELKRRGSLNYSVNFARAP